MIAYYLENRYIIYLAGGFCLFSRLQFLINTFLPDSRYALEECITLFLLQQSGGRYQIRKAVRYSLLWGVFVGGSWVI